MFSVHTDNSIQLFKRSCNHRTPHIRILHRRPPWTQIIPLMTDRHLSVTRLTEDHGLQVIEFTNYLWYISR